MNPIDQGFVPLAQGEIEVTDMFCGAGGSSLGLEMTGRMRVTQAS